MRVAVAVIGPFGTESLGVKTPLADASTALAIATAVETGLGLTMSRQASTAPGFHPTRTAELSIADEVIGYCGELHPDIADHFELDGRVAVMELDLGSLVADQASVQMQPISTFPHVDFDLSFEVPMVASAGELATTTAQASALIEDARVFDDYRDEPAGLRAVAVRYRLRAPDRTLDAEEIAAERSKMIAEATALGARLRGGTEQNE
jgi:phenylalanyl-tRNA synthetase beta chain